MSDPNSGQYTYLRELLEGRANPTPPDPRESLVQALVKASSIPSPAPTPPKTGLQKAMEDAYLSTLPPASAIPAKAVPTPGTGGSLLSKLTPPSKPVVALKKAPLVKVATNRITPSTGKATATAKMKADVRAMLDAELTVVKSRSVPKVTDLPYAGGKAIESAVLFIDVRDSTSITNNHRSNEVAAKIYKAFLYPMVRVAKFNGAGHVRGFAGDRIMVMFDNQTDTIGGADRAVECAVWMQSMVEQVIAPQLRTKFNHPIECGIGIDYGNILAIRAGIQGYENNAAIWPGKATNIASKLCDAARPGKILITPRVVAQMSQSYKDRFKISSWGKTLLTTTNKTGPYVISPDNLRYTL